MLVCLCLPYFTSNHHLNFLFCDWTWHYFLLLYGWEILHCVYVPHHVSIHLKFLQLACFPDLAVATCGPRLQGCLLQFLFSLDLYPGVGFLGPKVLLCYFSNETPYCFLLDEPMYITINSSGGLPCLYILSSICSCLYSFIYSSVFGCPGPWLQKSSSLYLQWAGATLWFHCQNEASHCGGFWLQSEGSRAQAQQLCTYGLSGPTDVGSSETMVPTHVSCIGRHILHTAPPGKS